MISVTSAQARVGETVPQVEARYGKPMKRERRETYGFSREYSYQGFRVLVGFREGVSFAESYRKIPPAPFLDAEISALLKQHGDGGKWERLPLSTGAHPAVVIYRTPDGRAAIHDTVRHTLQLSKEMARVQQTIER